SGAKETEPIRPVDEGTVSATIPHLSPVLAAMVRLQLLTGMRPGEVCRLRPADVTIGKSGTWTYRPSVHKTEHHEGRERRIFIGPDGQGVLRRYLDRDPDAYCFSPRESVGRPGSAAARRGPGSRYTSASYRRAIARACERAGFEEWKPNQLRHTAATLIRERYGVEAAATVLGHSDPRVTAIYAERDFKLASDVIQKIG
ncbi:MAG TPA: site-specific integrase, partial [Planctomycetaceae bacterium]|nr:site-specific integrase [Planctomycetaceae bacterium]